MVVRHVFLHRIFLRSAEGAFPSIERHVVCAQLLGGVINQSTGISIPSKKIPVCVRRNELHPSGFPSFAAKRWDEGAA
jgi:hypothetical protein